MKRSTSTILAAMIATITATASLNGGMATMRVRVFNQFAVPTAPPPTVICPANISVLTDPGSSSATVSFAAPATDSRDGQITPTFQIGSTEITSPHVFSSGHESMESIRLQPGKENEIMLGRRLVVSATILMALLRTGIFTFSGLTRRGGN